MITMIRKLDSSAETRCEVSGWQAHVAGRLGWRIHDLCIDIVAQGLVLRGSCPTYFVKQLAQEALLEVASLPIAANRIEVTGSYVRGDGLDD